LGLGWSLNPNVLVLLSVLYSLVDGSPFHNDYNSGKSLFSYPGNVSFHNNSGERLFSYTEVSLMVVPFTTIVTPGSVESLLYRLENK